MAKQVQIHPRARNTVVAGKRGEDASEPKDQDSDSESTPDDNRGVSRATLATSARTMPAPYRGGRPEHIHKPIVRGSMHARPSPENVQPGRKMLDED